MSALIGFFAQQFERTTHSTRRLRWLMVALVLVAVAGVVLVLQRDTQSIEYPQRYLVATPAAVCPGEQFTYPVKIKIDKSDAVSRITEGWCRASDGICPKTFQSEAYYVNFLEPYSVSTTATRTVPIDLPPAEWQWRHCNETHSDGVISVVCYQVQVEVKDCAVPAP